MPSDNLNASTMSDAPVPGADEGVEPAVPALTLLCHPDVQRVGERAELETLRPGQPAQLSRMSPLFQHPGAEEASPLADAYISRTPVWLEARRDGAVRLSAGDSRTPICVADQEFAGEAEFSPDQLRRGVVVTLARRVVLLLHRLRRVRETDSRRFGLLGESEGIAAVRERIRRAANLPAPVLIRGETGSGKELVARAIHEASPRGRRSFVSVNMGALTPSLATAELFGSRKGAYTGAVSSQEGYFRRAHLGTLFLDEVGESSYEIQVMLLRALETGEIVSLGSQQSENIDVRVIAATDSGLERRVEAGDFRAPLLHRLAGYSILVPPLRERRDDIGRLLLHFLRQALREGGQEHRLQDSGEHGPWLSAPLVARLADYDWPGNVRQLQNVARQLVIDSRDREVLFISPELKRLMECTVSEPRTASAPPRADQAPAKRASGRLSDISDEQLVEALRANRWEVSAAARQLGFSRPAIYKRIERCPKVRTAGDLSAEEIEEAFRACQGDLNDMVDRLEVSASALWRRIRELRLA